MQRMTGMSHTCMWDVVRGTRPTGRHSPTQIDMQAVGTVSAPGQSWGASPARWLEASGRGKTSTQGHRAGLRQEQGHTGAGRSCRADNARHLKHVGRAPGGHVSISGRTDLTSDEAWSPPGSRQWGQGAVPQRELHTGPSGGVGTCSPAGKVGGGGGYRFRDGLPGGASKRGHLPCRSRPPPPVPQPPTRAVCQGPRSRGGPEPLCHRPALVRRPALGPCLGQKDCVWATTCCWNLILFLLSHPPSIYGKHTGHHSGLHHSFPFK